MVDYVEVKSVWKIINQAPVACACVRCRRAGSKMADHEKAERTIWRRTTGPMALAGSAVPRAAFGRSGRANHLYVDGRKRHTQLQRPQAGDRSRGQGPPCRS